MIYDICQSYGTMFFKALSPLWLIDYDAMLAVLQLFEFRHLSWEGAKAQPYLSPFSRNYNKKIIVPKGDYTRKRFNR